MGQHLLKYKRIPYTTQLPCKVSRRPVVQLRSSGTHLGYKRSASSQSSMAATTGLENDLKDLTIVKESYPQAKDADSDPSKLSAAVFSNVEYTPQDKTEIEQWLITARHIAAGATTAAAAGATVTSA